MKATKKRDPQAEALDALRRQVEMLHMEMGRIRTDLLDVIGRQNVELKELRSRADREDGELNAIKARESAQSMDMYRLGAVRNLVGAVLDLTGVPE